ncbi:transposase [Streptococcus pluranimalium]|uniref:transposase n=1 Tax=Streptococcus pluranimalium TaxID=82348 RepID=UPI003F6653F7
MYLVLDLRCAKACLAVYSVSLTCKTASSAAVAVAFNVSNLAWLTTNKLIKDIKRQAFGFRKFKNFKTKILIALNIQKERTGTILYRC